MASISEWRHQRRCDGMSNVMAALSTNFDFAAEEKRVLQLWDDLDAFQTSLKQSKEKPKFIFYDGPPFATGLPHYGHILTSTLKDIVPRWMHQHGYHVERRFGWDTHGLPVEHEIDKEYNISGPGDVAAIGIDEYNRRCRAIVMRYSAEWRQTITRLGRWVDFDNDYKTMYPWYMESLWWVFQQLWNKGLIYQGFRVMPYSTGCCTPLANFEVSQNYRETTDPSLFISFQLVRYSIAGKACATDVEVNIVAWTTTPWTLPSNLALCVHPDHEYVRLKLKSDGRQYVVMRSRADVVFPPTLKTCKSHLDKGSASKAKAEPQPAYDVIESFKGDALADLQFYPLFPYFACRQFLVNGVTPGKAEAGAFRILADNYVSADTGTGVVQCAPYFGEDDFRVCVAANVISASDRHPVCPVDSQGRFTAAVTDYAGQYVKDADKAIIKRLRDNGQLIQVSQIKHSYPFCWRSDTPILYKAVPSWFMRVEQMRDRLIAQLNRSKWVPDTIREGRFTNWLAGARDWNLSRNRYWGTPIPIWQSDDGVESVCVGSVDELRRLSGVTDIHDLHRETVDTVVIPSARSGHPPLRRIPEVFDCWFESGAMPYAQNHFPFDAAKSSSTSSTIRGTTKEVNGKPVKLDDIFPANFIAEGTDQTRGWFYTLLVLAVALFDQVPYNNLICSGLVLATDGQKMSKRKKNYPDPNEVISKYGADALRLYLVNSPIVRAENLRFKEQGVRDILKDVLLPWYNAFRFLMHGIVSSESETGVLFVYNVDKLLEGGCDQLNVMDHWILSYSQSLLAYVETEMAAYRLYNVLPRLVKHIDDLTNWYVRLNRRRIKGGPGQQHHPTALLTLFHVMWLMVKLLAPFTPFITEFMYQLMAPLVKEAETSEAGSDASAKRQSVHWSMIPLADSRFVDSAIERAVGRMQTIVELGRVVRDRQTLPLKYPLAELVIVATAATGDSDQYVADLASLRHYIAAELNVRCVTFTDDRAAYGVQMRVEPDFRVLGARLKSNMSVVATALRAMPADEIQQWLADGKATQRRVAGHDLSLNDVRVIYSVGGDGGAINANDDNSHNKYIAHSDGSCLILLDCSQSQALLEDGLVREVINRIQRMRKSLSLMPSDDVIVRYSVDTPPPTTEANALATVIAANAETIQEVTRSPIIPCDETGVVGLAGVLGSQVFDFKGGVKLNLTVVAAATTTKSNEKQCRYAVIEHAGGSAHIVLNNEVNVVNDVTSLADAAAAVFVGSRPCNFANLYTHKGQRVTSDCFRDEEVVLRLTTSPTPAASTSDASVGTSPVDVIVVKAIHGNAIYFCLLPCGGGATLSASPAARSVVVRHALRQVMKQKEQQRHDEPVLYADARCTVEMEWTDAHLTSSDITVYIKS